MEAESTSNHEVLHEFLVESRDALEVVEPLLLELERSLMIEGGVNGESIHAVFRLFHTLKGTAGFLDLPHVTRLTHEAESLLDLVRKRVTPLLPGHVEVLCQITDLVRNMLDTVEREHSDASCSDRVTRMAGAIRKVIAEVDGGPGPSAMGLQVGLAALAQPVQVRKSRPAPRSLQTKRPSMGPVGTLQARATVRVDAQKLDALMDLVGELVIARAAVTAPELKVRSRKCHEEASNELQRLSRQLHDIAVVMRMVPMSKLFRRLPRLVRDLADRQGKQVDFVIQGEDTEVDKAVIDLLADPLVHMLRNAVDHGIEWPQERTLRGKPIPGRLRLSAQYGDAEVCIRLEDDGRGLDRGRILEKAIASGIADPTRDYSDDDIYRMVLLPGLSTVSEVTDVSGRGVGMDVVSKNIQRLGGRIDISTTPGQGTQLVLRIPLNLAMIDSLLLRVGTTRYVVAASAVEEMVWATRDQIGGHPKRGEQLDWQGHQYPIVRLHQLHTVACDSDDLEEGTLVLVQSEGRRVCLFVDEVIGDRRVVTKPLPPYARRLRGVSGCAVMQDGEVSLVLDVDWLMAHGCKRGKRTK